MTTENKKKVLLISAELKQHFYNQICEAVADEVDMYEDNEEYNEMVTEISTIIGTDLLTK